MERDSEILSFIEKEFGKSVKGVSKEEIHASGISTLPKDYLSFLELAGKVTPYFLSFDYVTLDSYDYIKKGAEFMCSDIMETPNYPVFMNQQSYMFYYYDPEDNWKIKGFFEMDGINEEESYETFSELLVRLLKEMDKKNYEKFISGHW